MSHLQLTPAVYVAWAVVMILQNASFTWITRARVGESVVEHGLAIAFGTALGFLSALIGFDNFLAIIQARDVPRFLGTFALVLFCNLAGGLGAQKALVLLRGRKEP